MKATIDETKVATLEDGRKNGEAVRLSSRQRTSPDALLCETHRSQGCCLVLRHRYPLCSMSGPRIASCVVLAHLASYRWRHRVVSENTGLWLDDWSLFFERRSAGVSERSYARGGRASQLLTSAASSVRAASRTNYTSVNATQATNLQHRNEAQRQRP